MRAVWNLLLHPANYGVAEFLRCSVFLYPAHPRLSFNVYLFFVPKVTEITMDLLYIRIAREKNHNI